MFRPIDSSGSADRIGPRKYHEHEGKEYQWKSFSQVGISICWKVQKGKAISMTLYVVEDKG